MLQEFFGKNFVKKFGHIKKKVFTL